MSSDLEAGAPEGPKTVHGIDDLIDENLKAQRIHDTKEGVRNRAIDVDDVRDTVQDIESRVIAGARVILNIPHSEFILYSGAETIVSGPITSDPVNSSCQ